MNTLRNLGLPAPVYDDTPTDAETMRLWGQARQAQDPANNRMPVYGAPNQDRLAIQPNDVQLYNEDPGVTLASMGQKYRSVPPATFDQRFGPYQAPGPTPDARDQLRRLMEEQMLRNTPEGIVPGQRTWPYGHIQTQAPRPALQQMAGDVVSLPILRLPGMGPTQGQATGYQEPGKVEPFYPYTPGGDAAHREYLRRLSLSRRG